MSNVSDIMTSAAPLPTSTKVATGNEKFIHNMELNDAVNDKAQEAKNDVLLERESGWEDIFGTPDEFGGEIPGEYAKYYTMSTDGVNMIGFEEENDEDR